MKFWKWFIFFLLVATTFFETFLLWVYCEGSSILGNFIILPIVLFAGIITLLIFVLVEEPKIIENERKMKEADVKYKEIVRLMDEEPIKVLSRIKRRVDAELSVKQPI